MVTKSLSGRESLWLLRIHTNIFLPKSCFHTTFYLRVQASWHQNAPSNNGNCSNSLEISMLMTLFPIMDLLWLKATWVSHFPVCGWSWNIHLLTQFEWGKAFYFICWEEAGKHDFHRLSRLPPSFSLHKAREGPSLYQRKEEKQPTKGEYQPSLSLPFLLFCHYCSDLGSV